MVVIQLDFAFLTPAQASYLEETLPTDLLPAMQGKDPWGVEGGIVDGVVLMQGERVVGAALSALRQNLRYAELLSLTLGAECRQESSLLLLLNTLQNLLLAQRCTTLTYAYSELDPLRSLFEAVASRNGWSLPRLLTADFHFLRDDFTPEWMHKVTSRPLDPAFSVVLWHELPKSALAEVERQFTVGNIPAALSPFAGKYPVEGLNSLALCRGKEVVGWMVCHRIAPDTIQYTSFYTQANYHYFGLRLLAMAIFLQQRSGVRHALAVINVDQVDYTWFQFAKQRLLPLARTVERRFISVLEI